jgi:hypothetical protein
VRGDDERRSAREGGDQPGGDEEMRVDDVRPLRARRSRRAASELEIAELPSGAAVEHGEVDLVPPLHELPLDLGDEGAEVGRVAPGVHLGDQQDPHGASVRGPRRTLLAR